MTITTNGYGPDPWLAAQERRPQRPLPPVATPEDVKEAMEKKVYPVTENVKVTRVTIRNADGTVAKLGAEWHAYGTNTRNPRSYLGNRTGVSQFVNEWLKRHRPGTGTYAEIETGSVVFEPPVRVDS